MALVHKEVIQDVNKFLTNFATFYKAGNDVANFVAPPFKVKFEDGKYTEYTKSILRVWDDKIKGDEEPREIQWNIDEATYSCEEYAMGKFVSDKKKAQAELPVNLDKDAVKFLKRFHNMAREYRISNIAGNAALITQTGTPVTKWSVAGGTPVSDIIDAKGVVENATAGYIPNKILIDSQSAMKLIKTTEWKDYFKYTESGFGKGLWSAVSGLRFLGLEPMIANNYGLSEAKCTASDPRSEALWEEKCLVFYSEETPTLETRTFMYSPYVWQNIITTTRMTRRRGVYHDIYSDIDELLVDAQCAYLYTNVL